MEASRALRSPDRKRFRQLAPLRRNQSPDPAFEQLYKNHAREVYQYALALLTNPADAEDVTQTTFLTAYRAFQRGERPHKPHNWLIAIAHNVCRMRWRQSHSRPTEVALEDAPEPVAVDQEPTNLDEVLQALAGLSFNQRSALVMRELEGRSYQEIADLLGVSLSSVEALLFRARRRIRIDRGRLGIITTVPLPGSLSSLLGAGGGSMAAAGGTAVGADLVLKAAAVVVAGAVTAGAGYQSAQTLINAGHSRASASQGLLAAHRSRPAVAHAQPPQPAQKAARRGHPRIATRRDDGTRSVPSPVSSESGQASPGAPVEQRIGATEEPAAPSLALDVPPTPRVTTPPVTVPSVTVPPVSVPAVTVPAVTVPPLTTPTLALPPPLHP